MKHSSFAPVLREADQEIVGEVWAGEQCLRPPLPSHWAAFDEYGTQGVAFRCHDCLNCCEFDRRRVCRRLRDHYREYQGELFLVVFDVAIDEQRQFLRAARRWKGWKLEPASYRYDLGRVAMLARTNPHRLPRPRPRRWQHVTWKVYHPRRHKRSRHFRVMTRGMLTERLLWGKWLKRFYHRGLAQLERTVRWQKSLKCSLVQAFGCSKDARAYRLGVSILKSEDVRRHRSISVARGLFARNSELSARREAKVRWLEGLLATIHISTPPAKPAIRRSDDRPLRILSKGALTGSIHSAGDNQHPSVEKSPPARAAPRPGAITKAEEAAIVERFKRARDRRREDPS